LLYAVLVKDKSVFEHALLEKGTKRKHTVAGTLLSILIKQIAIALLWFESQDLWLCGKAMPIYEYYLLTINTAASKLWRIQEFEKVGPYGEREEREPIMGVWGQAPQWDPGAMPLVRESALRP